VGQVFLIFFRVSSFVVTEVFLVLNFDNPVYFGKIIVVMPMTLTLSSVKSRFVTDMYLYEFSGRIYAYYLLMKS